MGPERPPRRGGGRGLLPSPRQCVAARGFRAERHRNRRNQPMKIRALLEQNGKTAVGFAVPEDVVLSLGKGKRPPVNVTLNGYTYRSTVAPMGGRYLIGVSSDNRAAAGVAGGETHDIELTLDTAPREVELPP